MTHITADTDLDLSPPWRLAITVGCVLLVCAYMAWVVCDYTAFRLGSTAELKSIRRATRLSPWNSDLRWRLGRRLAFVDNDYDLAIAQYRISVQLNPHAARYWLDLAQALATVGDLRGQGEALQGAIHADPRTPDVAWQAANHYVMRGDIDAALRAFRMVIENDPGQAPAALLTCWRATADVQRILREALPPKVEPHLHLVHLLVLEKQAEAADAVWERVISLRQPFAPILSFSYVQFLLDSRNADKAVSAWADMIASNPGLRAYGRHADNPVVNSGFEEDLLNGGLDWRYRQRADVQLAIDTQSFHSGSRSLSVRFGGPATDDAGIVQFVPVSPNTEYALSAYTRTSDLISASGPRLGVYDARNNLPLALSDELLGTTSWQQRSISFTTGPDTNLVAIKLVRTPANTLVQGRVWIDDLRLTRRE